MGKERTKKRVSSKVNELPEEVRLQVDRMLADTSNTYQDISNWLKEEGFDVSKSSIGRYSMRNSSAVQRLLDAQIQTERLLQVVKHNPEVDYTEASMMMLMDGLVNKLATAEEEFDAMPLDKAGRLIVSLSRTKTYKDKVRQELRKKAEIAFSELESEMMKVIGQDEESAMQLKLILQKAKDRMVADD